MLATLAHVTVREKAIGGCSTMSCLREHSPGHRPPRDRPPYLTWRQGLQPTLERAVKQ